MPSSLSSQLDAAWSRAGHPPLCVAFSGGRDSLALLHALASLRTAQRSLRAVHVNHGLHADSDAWAASCARWCAQWDVPLEIVTVQVDLRGEGLEAAARTARYAAFADILRAGERLVTAHHRDDQAETVLLKLLRGAGPHGLGGMRELRSLGRGQLWRPLLATPRERLHAYARAQGLHGIDDPANADPRHARSFLRQTILPQLHRHWPEAERALAHAANLQREQADFIDQHAASALDTLCRANDRSMDAAGWLALHPALRACVLERWLHELDLPAPTTAQRHELERQMREAAADRLPRIAWPGAEVRLWRQRLYAMRPQAPLSGAWSTHWHGARLALPDSGALYWHGSTTDATAFPTIRVDLNVRGLHFRPHGDRHTRALRDLFQQAAVPPWLRRRCPILYTPDGALLGVADLWTTDAGAALFGEFDLWPRWQRET
ncbi:tRNA lysidine(34) synthetase TilS [Oleiagrimonas soli]|uniref:tRNA(Ile)-lysidine synthase n=1 Tax=Oleiagrimonas soli TaxID=1543381 RepID=A0A099CVI2_9GAMM|nr:tRNA lysidine(34) synthetase TilS [Oleiagrimonas soli]KGI77794.1 hypothetical protein LF63_0105050 [Oleiagrimonas soli]MBB6183876.1 tRNA(Ile)-lysidine synthase [Oleiagrimonas soli]